MVTVLTKYVEEAAHKQYQDIEKLRDSTKICTNKLESAKETKVDHICFDFEEADDASFVKFQNLVRAELKKRIPTEKYVAKLKANTPLEDLVEVSCCQNLVILGPFPFLSNLFSLLCHRSLQVY